MSDLSYNWSYETLPIQNQACPCCAEQFQLASGIIRDDNGADIALYVANLTPSTRPRAAELYLMFKDKTRRKNRDRVVSLVLRMEKGDMAMSVTTAKKNPLGRAMTREQVLASPLKSLIFEIADFVVENDPHVRPFLEEGSPGQGRETVPAITGKEPARQLDELHAHLQEKLLSFGGAEVVWRAPDPHAILLLARGEVFRQRPRMLRGEPQQCHRNVADRWARDPEKYQLVTGYGLSDGRWVSHSWLLHNKTLYETTHHYDLYFGVVLDETETLKFCLANLPRGQSHESRLSPEQFAANYPRLLPLIVKFMAVRGYEFVGPEKSVQSPKPKYTPEGNTETGTEAEAIPQDGSDPK